MTSARETAFDLLRRLLGGERGNLPMHLAMLLEKSSPLRNSDDHYRKILPPELADLKLAPETAKEIITVLCGEISRNPDAALIATVSSTGAKEATQEVTKLLIDPPRPLTTGECSQALAIAYAYLPAWLSRDRLLLSEEQKNHLFIRLSGLEHSGEITIETHARELLKSLKGLART